MRRGFIGSFRAALGVALVLSFVGSAQAQVGGILAGDNVWRVADSPVRVIDDLQIPVGARLTVEAGVEVLVAQDVGVEVLGTLTIDGTPEAPVRWAPAEEATRWDGITLRALAQLSMRHAFLEDARTSLDVDRAPAAFLAEDVTVQSAVGGGLEVDRTDDFVVRFTRLQAVTTGTVFTGTRSTIELIESRLSNGRVGSTVVRFDNSDATLFRVQILGGLFAAMTDRVVVSLDRCTVAGTLAGGGSNPYSGRFQVRRSILAGGLSGDVFHPMLNILEDSVVRASDQALRNLTGTTRASFPTVYFGSALLVDVANGDLRPTERSLARMLDPDDPTRTMGALDFDGAASPPGLHGAIYEDVVLPVGSTHVVEGDVWVAPGARLTLQPGVTLRMAAGADSLYGGSDVQRAELRVLGRLDVAGTPQRPVRMRSDAEAPERDDWYGLMVLEGATANLTRLEVSDAWRGLSISEVSPALQAVTVSRGQDAGVYVLDSEVDFSGLVVDQISGSALRAGRSTVRVSQGRLHGAVIGVEGIASDVTLVDTVVDGMSTHGVQMDPSAQQRRLTLERSTVVGNAGDGLRIEGGVDEAVTEVRLLASAVTDNSGVGVRGPPRGDGAAFECVDSNIWGNGEADLVVFERGPDCISANPLYVDLEGRDYAPTGWSPHRTGGPDGGHIGAIPYTDAPPASAMGFIPVDHVFTRLGSPHPVLGDLVVMPGATVRIEPGAELRFAAVDGMGAGDDPTRTELRVRPGGSLIVGLPVADQPAQGIGGAPVRLVPEPADARPGAWVGPIIEDGASSSLYNVTVEHADRALLAIGPTAPPVRFLSSRFAALGGLRFEGVFAAPMVDVHGAHVVGADRAVGVGLDLIDSGGRITSSVFTHHATGASVVSLLAEHPPVTISHGTFTAQDEGIVWAAAGGGRMEMRIFNSVVADSRTVALRDGDAARGNGERIVGNLFFGTDVVALLPHNDVARYRENISGDPRLEDLDPAATPRWWDARLQLESPGVDSGWDEAPEIPATDVLGRPRRQGSAVDRGAYEFEPDSDLQPRAEGVTRTIAGAVGVPVVLDGEAAFDPEGALAAAWWTTDDGGFLPGRVVEYSFPTPGLHSAWLTVVDAAGAEDHGVVTVEVGAPPIADAGPAVFQDQGPDESVLFDGAGSVDPDGQIVEWRWDFGDGSAPGQGPSPRHAYLSAGVYVVTLTVVDDSGLSASDTTTATVFGPLDLVGPLVEHRPIAGPIAAGRALEIEASANDPAGIAEVVLLWRTAGEDALDFAVMAPVGGDRFRGTIPGPAVQRPGVEYWIIARDGVEPDANASTTPLGAPGVAVWSVAVVDETDPPEIEHVPVADGQPRGAPVEIRARLTDATGIGQAAVVYRRDGGALAVAAMGPIGDDEWLARIPAAAVEPPGISYHLVVDDASAPPSRALSPAGAPAQVHHFTVAADAPVVGHAPVADAVAGTPIPIEATVDAAVALAAVDVAYRVPGAPWQRAALALAAGQTWRGAIPAAGVLAPTIEYVIEATDVEGRVGTSPPGAPAAVHRVAVGEPDLDGPRIEHEPVSDGQPALRAVRIEATIDDPAGLAQAQVHYRARGFPLYVAVELVREGDVWAARLPAEAIGPPAIEYYLRATDSLGNRSVLPAGGADAPLEFTVGPADVAGPVIEHEAVAGPRFVGADVELAVAADDGDGVAQVVVEYRAEGEADFAQRALEPDPDGLWRGVIPGASVIEPGMQYRIFAEDGLGNLSRAPADGVFAFAVEPPPDLEPPSIEHAPVDGPVIADGALPISMTVRDPSGVATVEVEVRAEGQEPWTAVAAELTGEALWVADVPVELLSAPGIEYGIVAIDEAGNQARLPDDEGGWPVEVLAVQDVRPVIEVGNLRAAVSTGTPVPLVATVTDRVAIEAVSAHVWSARTGQWSTTELGTRGADRYTGVVVAADVVPPEVLIVFEARNALGNSTLAPPEGEDMPYAVRVAPGPDTDGPIIMHTPPAGGQRGAPLSLTAEVTDASFLGPVTLTYRPLGTERWIERVMVTRQDQYVGEIPAVDADGVEYYLTAVDVLDNASFAPPGGAAEPYRVDYDPIMPEPEPEPEPDPEPAPEPEPEPEPDGGMQPDSGPRTDAGFTITPDPEEPTGCALDPDPSPGGGAAAALLLLVLIHRRRRLPR